VIGNFELQHPELFPGLYCPPFFSRLGLQRLPRSQQVGELA